VKSSSKKIKIKQKLGHEYICGGTTGKGGGKRRG
jgi:hypothetical protein